MNRNRIPEFAIVGHPNEGKSSVVSTLAEDDSVRVSATPGETIECQAFPVVIDGSEIIRFIDTPGFQNPKETLLWMKNYQDSGDSIVKSFTETHRSDHAFDNDCELFTPIIGGAGIIYVVDGSRPLRSVDKAEMEILRLTGRPRMAIINSKDEDNRYLEQWKNEFRKHFNSVRVFNAHKATYAERIALLESLKSIDQDWEPALETVISAFITDWEHRNSLTIEIICAMLNECLSYAVSKNMKDLSDEKTVKKELEKEYVRNIEKREKRAQEKIRKLFKQNIFNYDLPVHSIIRQDLFSEKTWQVLGLSPKQLITTAGLAGGSVGAAIDLAAAGLTFGIFTAIGGAIGAGWAALGGGKKLAKVKLSGLKLGGQQIKMGPNENIQFLYILIDRALIFYSHIINWAHGRRDYPVSSNKRQSEPAKESFTLKWDDDEKRICQNFFKAILKGDENRKEIALQELKEVLKDKLNNISHSEERSTDD